MLLKLAVKAKRTTWTFLKPMAHQLKKDSTTPSRIFQDQSWLEIAQTTIMCRISSSLKSLRNLLWKFSRWINRLYRDWVAFRILWIRWIRWLVGLCPIRDLEEGHYRLEERIRSLLRKMGPKWQMIRKIRRIYRWFIEIQMLIVMERNLVKSWENSILFRANICSYPKIHNQPAKKTYNLHQNLKPQPEPKNLKTSNWNVSISKATF